MEEELEEEEALVNVGVTGACNANDRKNIIQAIEDDTYLTAIFDCLG